MGWRSATPDLVMESGPGPGRRRQRGPSMSRRAATEVLWPHARGGLGQIFVAQDTAAPSPGRPQGDPARTCGGPGQPRAVPGRGGDHGEPGTSGDRAGLRAGLAARRPAVLRDAVHQGRGPGGGGPAVPRRCLAGLLRAGVPLAVAAIRQRLQHDRLCAQPRRPAPRHQAEQYHAGAVRRDAGAWTGAWPSRWAGPRRPGVADVADGPIVGLPAERGERLGDDRGPGGGDAGLHEPRAGRGGPGGDGPGQRRLQPGGDALCPADGPPAVLGRCRRGPPGCPAGPLRPAPGDPAAGAQGPGRHLPQSDGDGALRALCLGAGPGRRRRAMAGRRAGHRLREPRSAGARRWVKRHRPFVAGAVAAVVVDDDGAGARRAGPLDRLAQPGRGTARRIPATHPRDPEGRGGPGSARSGPRRR